MFNLTIQENYGHARANDEAMGSLNPLLWVFIIIWILAISTGSLIISIPVSLTTFFIQKRRLDRPRALRAAALGLFLTFILLFIAGCVIAAISVKGPLAL